MTDRTPTTEAEVASRNVRVSPQLMAQWATRTDDGRTITVEWGNPGPDGFYEPTFRVSGSTEAERQDEARAPLVAALDEVRDTAFRDGIEASIDIVQQSLDTVRAEDDGESRSIKTSIAAREHVISLLAGYHAALSREDRP